MLEPLPPSQQMVELTAGSRGTTWNGLWMVHEWCRQATAASSDLPPANGTCAPSVARTSPSKDCGRKHKQLGSTQLRRFVRLGRFRSSDARQNHATMFCDH